jgi:hypothetical protein
LIHYQNLNQKGMMPAMIAQTLIQDGKLLRGSNFMIEPLEQKYIQMAKSERVVVRDVMISAKKKSLKRTRPKGEINIYQRLLPSW